MFDVTNLENGRYGVVEVATGKRVGFSFKAIIYRNEEWNNWHSAFCFCKRLETSLDNF